MNPIIERLGEQPKIWWQKGNELVHPWVERLNDQSKVLRQKGNDLLVDLQERQGKLFDRGQKAVSTFEEAVLERATELMEWAYGVTGERSDVLKRSQEYLAERLAELQDAVEDEDEDGDEAGAETEKKPAVEAKAKKVKVEPPFPEYDKLNVKKLATRLGDCDKETLERARIYEEKTKGRKTVFETIDRLLSE